MSAVRTDVINKALIALGQPTSVGVDTDTRQTVVSLRSLYVSHAKILLGKYDWNFATKVVKLSQVSGTPVGWLFQFNKPANMQRILKVNSVPEMERTAGIPFEDREGLIYTNYEDTYLAYIDGTYATDDSGAWPEIVKKALAHDLALEVSPGLDLGETKITMLANRAARAETEARRWDAQQGKVKRPGLSEWQRNHVSGRRYTENP